MSRSDAKTVHRGIAHGHVPGRKRNRVADWRRFQFPRQSCVAILFEASKHVLVRQPLRRQLVRHLGDGDIRAIELRRSRRHLHANEGASRMAHQVDLALTEPLPKIVGQDDRVGYQLRRGDGLGPDVGAVGQT